MSDGLFIAVFCGLFGGLFGYLLGVAEGMQMVDVVIGSALFNPGF